MTKRKKKKNTWRCSFEGRTLHYLRKYQMKIFLWVKKDKKVYALLMVL